MTGSTAGQLAEAIRAAALDGISTLFLVPPGHCQYAYDLAATLSPPLAGSQIRYTLTYRKEPTAVLKIAPCTMAPDLVKSWPGRVILDHHVAEGWSLRPHQQAELEAAVRFSRARYPVIAEGKEC